MNTRSQQIEAAARAYLNDQNEITREDLREALEAPGDDQLFVLYQTGARSSTEGELMSAAQIMQAVGCTEEQARGVLAHIQATQITVERGTVTTIQRTIAHCSTCGKRQWHDGQTCIVCGEQR